MASQTLDSRCKPAGLKALILAAGEGTRLRPLTLERPKPMLPIGGKPLLEHLVLWLRSHGITDILINLHHKPASITDYFGDGHRFGVSITYSHEKRLLGTAGAARKLHSLLDDTFVVVYGDVFTNLNLTRVIRFHHRAGGSVRRPASVLGDTHRSGWSLTAPDKTTTWFSPTISAHAAGPFLTLSLYRVENPSACGLVELDEHGRVIRFVEKPPPDQVFTDLANAGVLVLEPGILDYIPPHTFYDFGRDLFPQLLKAGVPMFGLPLNGNEYLVDIGTPAGYARAEQTWTRQRRGN